MINNAAGSINDQPYNLDFSIGLTIVTATGTMGDITVVYD